MPSLTRLCQRLSRSHPKVAVYPIVADFLESVDLPQATASLWRLGFFPGSTIGNLDPAEAAHFLRLARHTLGPRALFLIGADLRKDPSVLLPAYDDAAGVTAAFNRNVLIRLNREAEAEFDPREFAHSAIWNEKKSRIEMHLVSLRTQTVLVAGHRIAFACGETIHTENSYKYTPQEVTEIAAQAGWWRRAMWTDPRRLFALYLFDADTPP
jgi:dimethylhistidine N-methyltransferase